MSSEPERQRLHPAWQATLLAVLALVAFASNSILCRLALANGSIDPASFTAIRLASGALLLAALMLAKRQTVLAAGDWPSAAMLFAYAIAFSLAYVGLSAGAGALILFGFVQATMILAASAGGMRPSPIQWLGLAVAMGGLAYLVAPGVGSPSLPHAALMAVAGVAWGVYSLRGKNASDAVGATCGNFVRAAPLALVAAVLALPFLHRTPSGAFWAALSGAVTSGLGYVAWYAALPSLGPIRAAVVQLSVPALAAFGGVLLLAEAFTPRLALATLVILAGIALAVLRKQPQRAT